MSGPTQHEADPNLPRLAQEVYADLRDADGKVSGEVFRTEYERRLAARHARLRADASASYRAMDGWDRVRTEAQWTDTVLQADAAVDSGTFLLERLGAERYLDPQLMAVLLGLRRRLIDEHGVQTAAELLIVDSIVLSYYHLIRVNGWIGDLQQWLESEFFSGKSLTAATGGNSPRRVDKVRGLTVEEIASQLVERLMPLLDRSNRMMLRNLKALAEQRRGPVPSVHIGTAGQVNVATQQVNAGANHGDRLRDVRDAGGRAE